jgi:hypothetical protein
MSHEAERAEIAVFVGRFGSGKTEVAINYALALVRGWGIWTFDSNSRLEASRKGQARGARPGHHVILIDLDIVTPYFRSREAASRMHEQGVEVVAPSVIGQHLDTPAITPQILGAIEQAAHPVVLDVGGDRQGARALGQFSHAIDQRGYRMHFVVNPYRPFTGSLEGLAAAISEIEASARLEVTSLVSNPNLIGETKVKHIVDGHARIEEFSRELGLPIAFVCADRRWEGRLSGAEFRQPMLFIDRYFVMAWE